MGLKITGFKEVDQELKRIRASMAPNINKAIEDTAKFGNQLAVDEIFNKYGFNSKSDIEDVFSFKTNSKKLLGIVSARRRPTAITRFKHTKRKIGFSVNVLRKNKVWFKGAFTFIGKNGNSVMINRIKGDNSWRYLDEKRASKAGTEIPNALWGPAPYDIFRNIRTDISPPIIKHLRERYGHHAK